MLRHLDPKWQESNKRKKEKERETERKCNKENEREKDDRERNEFGKTKWSTGRKTQRRQIKKH
jgi:hypothetical protein